jgi:SAM-dependent methyltransferase
MRWTNRQREVARLLAVRKGDRVLEVGYGPGTLIGLLAAQLADAHVEKGRAGDGDVTDRRFGDAHLVDHGVEDGYARDRRIGDGRTKDRRGGAGHVGDRGMGDDHAGDRGDGHAGVGRDAAGQVCGVDPSAEMRRLATVRNRAAVRSGLVDLRLGTADATGFPHEAFDYVVSVNNVALWPDLEAGLGELHRVTRPGGELVIAWHGGTAPSRLNRRYVLREELLDRIRDGLNARFTRVSRHELNTLTVFRALRSRGPVPEPWAP